LTVVRDKETRERLTTAFKLVSEGSNLNGEKVRQAANQIRKRFVRTNSAYGGVMLKAKRADLESEIEKLRALLEEHKQLVRQRFAKEVNKSVEELVQAFWRAVQKSPPNDLMAQIATQKPTAGEAKTYLTEKLKLVFPDVEKLCERMKVVFVTKDVTWETLNSPNFVDWLAKQFPVNSELKKPFEEYQAARARLDMKAKTPKALAQ
jgi:hypothetical protein